MNDYPLHRLGDLVKPVQDRIPDRTNWHFDKYIAGEHIDSGEVRIKKYGLIKGNEEVIGSAFHMRFRPSHVLYSTRRAYLRKAGIVDFEGICSNVTLVLQADEEKLLQSLLPFVLQSEDFVQFAVSHSIGSTNPFVKWTDLSKYRMKLPPLNIQEKISQILWAIEDNVEKTENLIQVAEKLKEGLLEELLIKGIGHKKFKKTELGEVPEEWAVCKLIDLAGKKDDIVAGPFGSNLKVEDYVDKGVPIIRLQNIERGQFVFKDMKYVSNEKADELKYHSFRKGDIVLAKLGDPIGKTCFVPDKLEKGIVTSDVVRIRLDVEKVEPSYMVHLLNSSIVLSQLDRGTIGTTRPRVNLKDVRQLVIPLPKIDEQSEISKILSITNNEILASKKNVRSLNFIKKKLANSFLSGELLIPKEDMD